MYGSCYLIQTQNSTFLSIASPSGPIVFPIVKAAATVPMPRPEICPQAEEGHAGGKKKAGYVKGDLDFWGRASDDPGEVSWGIGQLG